MRDLWTLSDGKPVRVRAGIGISDGNLTELTAGPLKEGDVVILDVAGAAPPQENIPRPPGFFR